MMMPLAPERTIYMAAKPKADFSIDFIVGNAKKSSSPAAVGNNNSPSAVTLSPRRGAVSPLTARRASPPHLGHALSVVEHHRAPGLLRDDRHRDARSRSPEFQQSADEEMQLREEELRSRLLGAHAHAALPGAGALHLHPHPPLGLPFGLGMPRGEAVSPASSPRSPSTPPHSPQHSPAHSPAHSPPGLPPHPHHPVVPQPLQQPSPFLFRGLYRPELVGLPPHAHQQFQLQQQLLAQQEAQAQGHGLPPHPHPHPHLQLPHLQHPGALHHSPTAPPKDSYPLYPWLLSRHGRIFPHRFPAGPDFAGFLLHPFRKPKRIRTAFSPSQLLKLEHAFENNHYVVGAERKQVAQALGLSETQVKVWFQNRRTKHKRTEQEEEAKTQRPKSSNPSGGDSNSSATNNNNNKQLDVEGVDSMRPSSSLSGPLSPGSCSPPPSMMHMHRPVDLSSQDDSSDMESES